MTDKQFFNNLSATYADVRKLDVKKINLKGKNILEYIKDATPTIKHSQDTRETVTENDIWGTWIETMSDGTIIVHDDEVINPNVSSSSAWNTSITKVEDNKAYIGDEFYANIQHEKLKNGNSLFSGCSNFDITLANVTINTFPNLEDGTCMFKNCSNLTTWICYSNKISTAQSMFEGCGKLSNLNIEFGNIINARGMFSGCSEIVFETNLIPNTNNLQLAGGMFRNCPKAFEHFNWKLPKVAGANLMFQNCTSLKSFSSDLPSLIDGQQMFEGCTNLSSFSGCLSSLTKANNMFSECKLDANSILYIIDSINDLAVLSKTGILTLGINVSNNAETIQQQLEDFAQEATFDSWTDLKQAFVDKGWTVTFQYGGTNTSITYDLREGEQIIPCSIFAKLIQVEDKDSAQYCTEDASSFYNIEWGHDVTDTSAYTQFNSLEDAMTSWNVFPKENIITTEEA